MSDDLNPYRSPPDQSYAENNPNATNIDTAGQAIIPFESGHARAVRAMIVLGLILGLSVIGIAANLYEINLLSTPNSGPDWNAKAEISYMCRMVLWLISFVAYIVSAIFFIMWFHRAHRNLPALGALLLKYSPGWAVGGWFFPILNLFRPYQVMAEVWRCSLPQEDAKKTFMASTDRGSHALVGWWWAAHLIMIIFEQISSRETLEAESIQSLIDANWTLIISNVITIPAALLAILVIKHIDLNQEFRYRELHSMGEYDWQQ